LAHSRARFPSKWVFCPCHYTFFIPSKAHYKEILMDHVTQHSPPLHHMLKTH
jgi:hypothetical protein